MPAQFGMSSASLLPLLPQRVFVPPPEFCPNWKVRVEGREIRKAGVARPAVSSASYAGIRRRRGPFAARPYARDETCQSA